MSRGGGGRVRIVAGENKGRLIRVADGQGIRPTADMVREAVFDVLGEVGGLRVLDLFAGSGALGLEALSRGAESCVFVECAPRVVSVLRENVVSLGYEDRSRVLRNDYRSAVRSLQKEGSSFDLLFLDPPYRMLAEVEEALSGVGPGLLSHGGVMVIEGPRPVGNVFGLAPVFERRYGDTKITMVRIEE